jgi:hypothetical protein
MSFYLIPTLDFQDGIFRVATNLLPVFEPRVAKAQPWAGISERFQRRRILVYCSVRWKRRDCDELGIGRRQEVRPSPHFYGDDAHAATFSTLVCPVA